MFRNLTFLQMLLKNLALIGIWQAVVVLACRTLPDTLFDPSRSIYHSRKWEQGGRWYRVHLRIHEWKDRVPQFIADGGFSKKALGSDLTVEYLDRFILETCRGEWMHTFGGVCVLPILLMNTQLAGLAIAVPLVLGTFPFVVIQRYNRFRLQTLRKKLLRDQARAQNAPAPI